MVTSLLGKEKKRSGKLSVVGNDLAIWMPAKPRFGCGAQGTRAAMARGVLVALILGSTRLVMSHLKGRQELQAYGRLGQDHVDEAASYSFFMSGCKGLSGLTHSFALMAIIYFGIRKASAQDGLGSVGSRGAHGPA